MTRLSETIALVLAIFTFAVWPAQAAIYPGEWFLSGGFGGVTGHRSITFPSAAGYNYSLLPFQNTREDLGVEVKGPAIDYSGEILYHVTPNVGFGLEVLAPMFSAHYPSAGFTLDSSGNYNEQLYQAVGRYVFLPEHNWYPYVLGGAGFANITLQGFSATNSNGYYFFDNSASEKTFACSLALGMEGQLTGPAITGFELGFAYTAPKQSGAQISALFAPYLNLRFGFGFGGSGRQ